MKANQFISKTERKLLLIFAFLFFSFILITFVTNSINSYNYSIIEQQNDLESFPSNQSKLRFSSFQTGTHQIPGLHFLTILIFVALYKSKKFLISSLLTIFYVIVSIYGLALRFDGGRLGGEEFSSKVDFLNKLYYEANSFDYFAALFISILLFWQISILLRILVKTLQRKSELP